MNPARSVALLVASGAVLLLGAGRASPPGADAQLRTDVRQELDGRGGDATDAVTVTVIDGDATLGGRVELLRDAWRAEEIAGEVAGIVSVRDRSKVDDHQRTDGAIADELSRRIAGDPALSSAGVRVDVRQGRAIFSGTIPDARLRFAARAIAGETEGVVAFEDRLESPAADDDVIEKELTAVLAPGSLTGSPGRVDVAVSAGRVTLTGVVPTVAARRLAETRAWGINGVRGVVDEIRVASRTKPV